MTERHQLLPINGRGAGIPTTCSICSRGDGDCRISANGELILCHLGSTYSPSVTKAGDTFTDANGRRWRCDGPTADNRCIGFHLKPATPAAAKPSMATHNHTTTQNTPTNTTRAMSDSAQRQSQQIQLARLHQPAKELPPAHLPDGANLPYSPRQRVQVVAKQGEKKRFRPLHLPDHIAIDSDEARDQWVAKAGPHPWPLYRQDEAITHGRGAWIVDTEGEKCCQWFRCGGLVAVSHPGHNFTIDACTARYRSLVDAGIAGVVYVADNDPKGAEKAQILLKAAGMAGLPIRIIPANAIWPNLPDGGSIDDAPGTPAERIEAFLKAVAQVAASWMDDQSNSKRPPLDEPPRIKSRAQLQQFLASNYRLEFNELTRICEINGNPLEDHHLADSFLAQQHGIEVSKQMAADSLEFIAKSNPYNPVRRYLLGLRERSDLRLISMQELAAAFAIEPHDRVSQRLLAAHLAGAALRGLTPGHKHDQLLVFKGNQGTCKSSGIEALAGPWYDSATRVEELESKDFLSRINGAWLFEIDECEHTLLKRTASEFKGFLSRRNDRYVEKYEKAPKTHWRRSALFGTTNQAEFLNDSTGNRRAWVIDTGDRELSPQWISANRDSIWATVLTWIDWGLTSYVQDDELAAEAAKRAQEASLSDPWEPLLAKVLETIPIDATGGIALDDLASRALRIDAQSHGRDTQMRITRVVTAADFRTHGGTVAWRSKKRRYGGGRSRAGYEPVLQPRDRETTGSSSSSTVPTVPTTQDPDEGVGTGLGTAQTPWNDRALTTPFQPVPTYFLKKEIEKEKPPQNGAQGSVGDKPLSTLGVGTGRNTPETPSAAVDLGDPTGSEQQLGQNGTARLEEGTPSISLGTGAAAAAVAVPSDPPPEPSPEPPPAPPSVMARHYRQQDQRPAQCQFAPLGAELLTFLADRQDKPDPADPDQSRLHAALDRRIGELLGAGLLKPSPAPISMEPPQPPTTATPTAMPTTELTSWFSTLTPWQRRALQLRAAGNQSIPAKLINRLAAELGADAVPASARQLLQFLQGAEAIAWIADNADTQGAA